MTVSECYNTVVNNRLFFSLQLSAFEDALISSIKSSEKESEAEDEAAIFGKTLVTKLRRLTPYQMALAQPRLLQVLTEIEFCSQSPAPSPSVPATQQYYHGNYGSYAQL